MNLIGRLLTYIIIDSFSVNTSPPCIDLSFLYMENSIDAWYSYRAARNLYKVKLVNSKHQYINSRINTAKDQKEMWNRIKNLVLGEPRK